jgi:hypothetical protein
MNIGTSDFQFKFYALDLVMKYERVIKTISFVSIIIIILVRLVWNEMFC